MGLRNLRLREHKSGISWCCCRVVRDMDLGGRGDSTTNGTVLRSSVTAVMGPHAFSFNQNPQHTRLNHAQQQPNMDEEDSIRST